MEISFDNKQLRNLCEDDHESARAYGLSLAGKLKARLSDIEAVDNVSELPVGLPREVVEGGLDMAVDIGDDTRLVFRANHKVVPKLDSGAVDWTRVSRVKILRIERNDG